MVTFTPILQTILHDFNKTRTQSKLLIFASLSETKNKTTQHNIIQ